MVFFSYIAANMLWLFVRSLFRNTVDFIAGNPSVNEKSDYLESNMILMCVVESFISPALVSLAILTLPKSLVVGDDIDLTQSMENKIFISLFFVITALQSLFSLFANFVTFYKYKGHETRNRNMIYIHYGFLVVTLLILPPLTAILYAVWWFRMDSSVLANQVINSWLLMITISNFTMISYYFIIFKEIFNTIYADWQSNMELDEIEKAIHEKIARGDELTEVEKAKGPPPLMPYKDRERFYGTGPLRIGKPFTFKEDIYSLLFIANVRREYKD